MDILSHSVLPFLAMLVVLIVVHELGHYVTAKLAGVKVLEFGLGYPPRLWGVKRGETEYTVNALPLGGFVRLLGEEDPSDPRSLAAKPRWVRLVVLASGAFMNLVLAVFLFSLALSIPREVDISRARIGDIVPGSPAEEAGLKPGDIIYAVDGHDVQSVGELSYRIRLNLGEHIDFKVKRAGSATSGSEFVVVKDVYARWSTDPYVWSSAIAPDDAVRATDTMPRDLRVQATSGFSDGVLIMSPGAANEERFAYRVKDATTLTLTERALGGTAAHDHAAATPIERRVGQGPTGISIGPAFGRLEPVPLDVQEELRKELGPDATIPTTRLVPYSETQWQPPWEAAPHGFTRAYESIILARNEITSRIRGGISGGGSGAGLTGPVGIAQLTGEVVKEAGWKSLMDFAALLSMNLAVLNILPLPMLDGGRVVFVLLEYARGGKRVAPQKEAMVHFVGLVLILTFAVIVTYFDVLRIFGGESILR